MAGATRPVGGGAYSGPRSEPGGQNTPRAGRVVASYGTYTVAIGTFAQQVDQGDIWDDSADPTATITAAGSGADSYAYTDTTPGTVTASGTATESYTGPITNTDAASGTVTATGTKTESCVYGDNATYYDNVTDADNPVSHWKLGDPTTAADRKGLSNLPAVAGPITTASGLLANNSTDSANTFTGTQRFELGAATGRGVPYETANWTVEAWIKPAAIGSQQYALRRGNQYILITGGGTLRFDINGDGSDHLLTLLSPAVAGTTYHVVATYDATNVIGYVNGVEKTRAAITTPLSAPTRAPIIGGDQAGAGSPFTGTVDEVAWYPAALTAARVLAHYQAGTTPAGVTAPGTGTLALTGTGTELYVPPGTTYTDTATGTLTATGTGPETSAYTDTSSGTVTATGTGADSYAYTDASIGVANTAGTGAETESHTGQGAGTLQTAGTGTETHTHDDTRSGVVALTGTATETFAATYADTATGSVEPTGSGTDSYADTDTTTGELTTAGTSTDTHLADDTTPGQLTTTGTSLENYQPPTTHTDTTTGTTTTTGTSLETYTYTDTATGSLALTGTATETWGVVYQDTTPGQLTAAGTSTDTQTYTDTTLGLATLTGTGTDSTTPRQLAVSTITLNQPRYNIAIHNGHMATTITPTTPPPTIRITPTTPITTSIEDATPITVALDRIT